ncbi:MAG: hypothetical protein WA418_20660 [Bradyrhizobium sp.]
MNFERVFVRVYRLPDQLTDGFCFGGGKPITFVNVDWFEAIVSEGVDVLTKYIKSKTYFSGRARFLVLGDRPDFVFTIDAEEKP